MTALAAVMVLALSGLADQQPPRVRVTVFRATMEDPALARVETRLAEGLIAAMRADSALEYVDRLAELAAARADSSCRGRPCLSGPIHYGAVIMVQRDSGRITARVQLIDVETAMVLAAETRDVTDDDSAAVARMVPAALGAFKRQLTRRAARRPGVPR